jgi:hypothetical protein
MSGSLSDGHFVQSSDGHMRVKVCRSDTDNNTWNTETVSAVCSRTGMQPDDRELRDK